MEKNEKKNILIITAGIFLIVLVAFLTFFKSPFGKNKNPEATPVDSVYLQNIKRAQSITSEEVQKKVLKNENLTIIDIRNPQEHTNDHILDSVNIPYPDLAMAVENLSKEKTYVLVDDGSMLQAAYAAGGIFTENNFASVFYLSGGFPAWKNKINLTVSTGNPTSFTDRSKITYVSSDDLQKNITRVKLFILDLRPSDQFQAGHIKGAVNVPLEELEKARKTIPLGRKIVLYDEDGLRAFQGGVKMYDMGFLNTATLSDGFPAWTEKGYEVVK